jgi:hypothetical protein
MLRKGRLPKLFGVEACASLVPLAESMSSGDPISTASLERLAPINRIDVGEAQLLAAVADLGDLLLTGDKRALVAVGHLPNFPPLLAGKIVTLEAILISLCSKLGGDAYPRSGRYEQYRFTSPVRSLLGGTGLMRAGYSQTRAS